MKYLKTLYLIQTTISNMGNIQGCSDGCYNWLKGYNQTLARLRTSYRLEFKETIFHQTCQNFLSQLHQASQNGLSLDFDSQRFKGSLIDSFYSQSVLMDSRIKNSNQNLPGRITSMSQNEKKQFISELIKKSYIFLDISDIFDQQQNKFYEAEVKHKIFQNDQSMMTQSFFSGKEEIVDLLRKFDAATIHKLQSYVQLAEIIKKSYQISTDSLLSKFLLRLKSKLIETFNITQDIYVLLGNTRTIINIIYSTTIVLFNINLKGQKSKTLHFGFHQKQTGTDSVWEQQNDGVQFINQTNLNTLATCILFDDQDFHSFYERSILDFFKIQFNKYKKQTVMTDQMLNSKLLGEDDSFKSYFQPTIIGLFNKKTQQVNSFQKTIKMFSKLQKKTQPVLKLKVLAEVQKQFLKELKKFSEQKNTQIVYDRTKSQLLATWLLNRQKLQGQKSVASIIIAYSFIHNLYRIGAKGSTILSFVQNVEKILSWAIPTQ